MCFGVNKIECRRYLKFGDARIDNLTGRKVDTQDTHTHIIHGLFANTLSLSCHPPSDLITTTTTNHHGYGH